MIGDRSRTDDEADENRARSIEVKGPSAVEWVRKGKEGGMRGAGSLAEAYAPLEPCM